MTDPFSVRHLHSDLGRRSARGVTIALSVQWLRLLLQLGSMVVLARLLVPEDFGLVAMVAFVTGFFVTVKDLGLSISTVQREEITHEQISNLFWVNVVAGGILTLVVVALAYPLAAWFGRDELVALAMVMSTVFLIHGLGVQHGALLQRQMRFVAIGGTLIGALAGSIALAITAASLGAGYWALVTQQLSYAAFVTLGHWIAARWLPGRPRRGVGTRKLIAFGSYLAGFHGLNYFARQTDKILVGWLFGAANLGLYTKAFSVLTLPIVSVTFPLANVLIPYFSRVRNERARFEEAYATFFAAVVAVSVPLGVAVYVYAESVVAILLGPNWDEAAVVLRVLAISMPLQMLYNTQEWLFTVTGRTRRLLFWGIAQTVTIAVCVGIGAQQGVLAIAWWYCVAMGIVTPCAVVLGWRAAGFRMAAALGPLARGLVAGAVALAVAWPLQSAQAVSPWLGGVCAALAFVVGSSVAVASSRNLRGTMSRVWRHNVRRTA